MKRLLLLLTPALLLVSCHRDKPVQTLRSAYYWSTTWKMDSGKIGFIREHGIRRLYVRYFDVVKDEGGNAVPNATLQFDTSPVPKGMEIVPTVYIVNDCMKPDPSLAGKILGRILRMSEANGIPPVKEIQTDCDWTASTQDTYFNFLKQLRAKAQKKNIRLSATIRLHQLSMTPPPVDKGVLMMYNTGDVRQLECKKPILDMKDAAPYIQHLGAYPLPLSAAYPLFSWRILFRDKKFVGIMHADDDFPVLPGDSIVTRQPGMEDIMEAVRSINHQSRETNNEVILFDLNDQNIKRFKYSDYEKIYQH